MFFILFNILLNLVPSSGKEVCIVRSDGSRNCMNDSPATSEPNKYHVSARFGETSSNPVLSDSAQAQAQGAAVVVLNIANQISTLGEVWNLLSKDAIERAERYAPPSYTRVPPTSPEQWAAIREKAKQENAKASKEEDARLAAEIVKNAAEFERHLKQTVQSHAESNEKYIASFAVTPEEQIERARTKQFLADASERRKGNFPESDIERFKDRLEKALFQETDLKKAMLELDIIKALGERSQSPKGQQQIKDLLNEFLDEQGLVKKWRSQFPQAQTIAFASSTDSANGQRIRKAINQALMRYGLSEARNDSQGQEIGRIIFDNVLQADAGFTKSEEQGKRYLDRINRLVAFATNDSSIKRWYSPQKIPVFIENEFGLSDVSADTFLGHEIIHTAQLLDKHRNILSDEITRFFLGTSLYQAKIFASENRIREALGMLDQVIAVIDFAVGLIPIIGDTKDICEAATGYAMCIPGGQRLSTEDRIFSAMGVVAGSGSMWREASKLLRGPVGDLLSFGEEQLVKLGRLKYTGDGEWTSTAGLVYGNDQRFLNRVRHVLEHYKLKPGKESHNIFSIPKNKVLELIDEAWILRGEALASDPYAYIVPLNKVIGTNGETTLKIIVTTPGGNAIKTAYPVNPRVN